MEESFHRAILPNIEWWSTKENRLSSACFKDKKGLSTDRRAKRTAAETTEFLKTHKPDGVGEAIIPESLCQEIECRILDRPIDGNPYHTEIHGKERPKLTGSQLYAIANRCEFFPWSE